jgi:transcriptional regulator with XRE-family HTH domain
MNKIERARVFRERLAERMTAVDMNRSALARACGVDRSTIAQLLDEDGARLPNAHLAAQCAWALRVSADWLLGLTERRETAADLLDATFRFADAAHTPADQQILDWLTGREEVAAEHDTALFKRIREGAVQAVKTEDR